LRLRIKIQIDEKTIKKLSQSKIPRVYGELSSWVNGGGTATKSSDAPILLQETLQKIDSIDAFLQVQFALEEPKYKN
jgi:hypothetical protein